MKECPRASILIIPSGLPDLRFIPLLKKRVQFRRAVVVWKTGYES